MSENQAIASTEVTGETPAAAEARKRAAAANFLPIVRGRLPLIFVHAIRFDPVLTAMSNKDLCTKFATSVGKIFDIKKGRNFGYVTATFKPTAEDVKAAEDWIAQVGGQNAKGMATVGDKNVMQTTLDAYKTAGLATAEEAAAFSAQRTSTRAKTEKSATTATGEHTHKRSTDEVQTAGASDDLLS